MIEMKTLILLPLFVVLLSCKKDNQSYHEFTETTIASIDTVLGDFPITTVKKYYVFQLSDEGARQLANEKTFTENKKPFNFINGIRYLQGDQVILNGKYFVALKANQGYNPETDSYHWFEGIEKIIIKTTFIKITQF